MDEDGMPYDLSDAERELWMDAEKTFKDWPELLIRWKSDFLFFRGEEWSEKQIRKVFGATTWQH